MDNEREGPSLPEEREITNVYPVPTEIKEAEKDDATTLSPEEKAAFNKQMKDATKKLADKGINVATVTEREGGGISIEGGADARKVHARVEQKAKTKKESGYLKFLYNIIRKWLRGPQAQTQK